MQLTLPLRVTALCALCALPAAGQDLSSDVRTSVTPEATASVLPATPAPDTGLADAAQAQFPLRPSAPVFGPEAPRAASPFLSIGHDLRHFFTPQTAALVGTFGGLALIGHAWDDELIDEAPEDLAPSTFKSGNVGGSFLVQLGAAVGTWGIGKATGSARATAVGGDLFRAQVLSQVLVQGAKMATQRTRPDGSNDHSFPSGHTASAFATASVLQRHFGWKAGVPAYAFGAYVGAARMSANKHHLSDVLMGAGIGIASGYSVTVGVGRQQFALGVTPTVGGAAVTFTKK
jgi:membrane-associated phospholipid phosphatase